MEPQAELRRRVVAIRSDATLSASQKARELHMLFNPPPAAESGGGGEVVFRKGEVVPEHVAIPEVCEHYPTRGCALVAKCCGKLAACRFCHNEESDHEIDRFATELIVCRGCRLVQEVSNECVGCGEKFGEYFCGECKLWKDAEYRQNAMGERECATFHCDKCGICRMGMRSEFFHCDACGICLHVSTRDDHTCFQNKFKQRCAVCRMSLHDSQSAPVSMARCNHVLHARCFTELVRHGEYRCPLCKTSMIDMAGEWRKVRRSIALQPLEAGMLRFCDAICNDCCQPSTNLLFHPLGVACARDGCGSFNTALDGFRRPSTSQAQQIRARLVRERNALLRRERPPTPPAADGGMEVQDGESDEDFPDAGEMLATASWEAEESGEGSGDNAPQGEAGASGAAAGAGAAGAIVENVLNLGMELARLHAEEDAAEGPR